MKHKISRKSHSRKLILLSVFAFMLSILLGSCTSPQDSIFEGLFSTSFEVSIFYPCGVSTPNSVEDGFGDFDTGYWLTSTRDSGFNEQLKSYEYLLAPTGELNMYVKFIGTTSPENQNGYGHLGMYSKQITVKELLDMKPWVDNQCLLE